MESAGSSSSLILLLALCPMLGLAGETPYQPGAAPDGAVSFGKSTNFPENIWSEGHPGYAVQTGYEGYLVPAESLSIKDIIKTAGYLAALPVIGKVALKLVLKTGVVVLALGAVVAIAVLLTKALCAFTPVCQLTLYKLDKWHHWDRESVRSLLNHDTINTAADFLTSAMAKYGGNKTAPNTQ